MVSEALRVSLLSSYGLSLLALSITSSVFFIWLGSTTDEIQRNAEAEIDQMPCYELKDYILNKEWKKYDARQTVIGEHAVHTYTWRCEK